MSVVVAGVADEMRCYLLLIVLLVHPLFGGVRFLALLLKVGVVEGVIISIAVCCI